MGARIESAAAQRAHRLPLLNGAIHASDAVARACLERARRRAEELDLLVNAGLYKDGNLAEPALASIIQEDIGANPGHPPRRDRHGTFSFDVLNGGCGALTALQLVDGFVGAGSAQLGMVVAADCDPDPKRTVGFPFAPVGGAILLGHAAGDEGFARFEQHTFADDADLFETRLAYEPGVGAVLRVREDASFASRCVERASRVALAFLDRAALRVADVDLLVAGAYPIRFAVEVARAVGIAGDRLPALPPALAGAHTAGPIAALVAAMDSGAFARARNVLFVAAGAGLTVGVALYRR